jgi:hypothetical protein
MDIERPSMPEPGTATPRGGGVGDAGGAADAGAATINGVAVGPGSGDEGFDG